LKNNNVDDKNGGNMAHGKIMLFIKKEGGAKI